ncbi:ribosome biogenesis protein SLX9-domain-containing protein [Polychytrium aggregatum]|uniref:ribosome biogenesis protein SLX9-domain-containing protein n=1 Tax=Polychytrium aggregatum TaxID=110093 RepID=UPI0022FE962D|nr:ribosome biogenesis protein SLX9-domain-containing protein [Polychytrium aggregatum]KAI9207594.1 ribosome biogenesis protein SLX9-domain-containing protein [Polychytrium aggregatum]
MGAGNKKFKARSGSAAAAPAAAAVAEAGPSRTAKTVLDKTAGSKRIIDKKSKRLQKQSSWLSKLQKATESSKATALKKHLDLSSIKSALGSVGLVGGSGAGISAAPAGAVAPGTASSFHKSQKNRKKTTVSEVTRLQSVLQHPAFKSNPLATIQQHIKNTMTQAGAPSS